MKYRILLASILKTVDDTRMYEKFALSLAKIHNVEIYIVGHKCTGTVNGKIRTYPIFDFKRLNPKRVLAGFRLWQFLLKVKPQIIIPSTPELLGVIIVFKIIFGCKIIYDVQENYNYNIRFGARYWRPANFILAWIIRLKERIAAPFIHTHFLAEKCYDEEMPYLKPKSIILENKFKPYGTVNYMQRNKYPLHLIYTGTIASTYGIFEAISLAKELIALDGGTFTIIGFSPDHRILEKLRREIKGDNSINLIGGDYLVPHKDILAKIQEANLGIISYRDNPSINNKMPTKLYEYLALQLPFIVPENDQWIKIAGKYSACIPVDFNQPDPQAILDSFKYTSFYFETPGKEVLWEAEEDKLLSAIKSLL